MIDQAIPALGISEIPKPMWIRVLAPPISIPHAVLQPLWNPSRGSVPIWGTSFRGYRDRGTPGYPLRPLRGRRAGTGRFEASRRGFNPSLPGGTMVSKHERGDEPPGLSAPEAMMGRWIGNTLVGGISERSAPHPQSAPTHDATHARWHPPPASRNRSPPKIVKRHASRTPRPA
jgi:hypothetical protein